MSLDAQDFIALWNRADRFRDEARLNASVTPEESGALDALKEQAEVAYNANDVETIDLLCEQLTKAAVHFGRLANAFTNTRRHVGPV